MALLLVGIPDSIFDRVIAKIRSALPGQQIIAKPLRRNKSGNYGVSEDDCLGALQTLQRACEGDAQVLRSGLGVVILRRPWEEARYASIFFPYGLVRHGVSDNANVRGKALQEVANSTANTLARHCASIIPIIKAVSNRFQTTNGKTRALLPLNSFLSADLRNSIAKLSSEVAYSGDPKSTLKQFDDSLSARIPMARDGGSYFLDEAGRWFKMPGRALHGAFRSPPENGLTEGAHTIKCFLNAKLRLGGVVQDGFHFDCTIAGGELSGEFEICHPERATFKGRPHLNIYVNDFIRA